MSFPNYVDYLVRQEQYQDLLREAKQQRMIKAAKSHPGRYRAMAIWIGAQVMKLSSTLVDFAAALSPKTTWMRTTDSNGRL